MVCSAYKYQQYIKCWHQHVLGMCQTAFWFLMVIDLVSCHQIKDNVNYPRMASEVRFQYVIPHVYSSGVMQAKLDGVWNWHYFSNDEVPVDYSINDIERRTITQSLALMLRESVQLFETKNFRSHTNMNPWVQMISVIAKVISTTTSEWQKTIPYGGIKYLSRENLLNQHNNIIHDSDIKSTQGITASTSRSSIYQDNFNSCQSCQMREKAKHKNLESIKNHILIRLQLLRLPNITKPIAVPYSIIDKFYKNFNSMRADNSRNAAFYDISSGLEIKTNGADSISLTHTNTPRQTEKDVPFLKHYTKNVRNVMSHSRNFQYGQQQRYQHTFNPPKYQSFQNLHNQPSSNPRISIPKDKKDTQDLSDIEYEQKGDVQNDELQQNSHYQQIFSRIRRKELTIHEIGQLLFNAKESGIISPALNDGNYDENYEHIRDIDDEFYSHVNSIYIFPTTSASRRPTSMRIIMVCSAYKYQQYIKCWHQHVLGMCQTAFWFLMVIDLVSCHQIKDNVNYPRMASEVRFQYVIPHVYSSGVMQAKLDGVWNWHYFSNDEVPVDYSINDIERRTITQSLALMLRESVQLFETKNFRSHTNMNPWVQMISVIAKVISTTTSEWQKTIPYGGIKYLSRENLLNQHNNIIHDSDIKSTQGITASTSRSSIYQDNFNSCQSCQMREKAKHKNLESIKNHILIRLQLLRLPNITKPIAVPYSIIDKFYKNFNSMRADNSRNAAFYDISSGLEINTNGADSISLTHTNTPRKTEKDVPFLKHYTKNVRNVMSHSRNFQYGQQQRYQHTFNPPKYQSFQNLHNQPSSNPRISIPKDKKDTQDLSDIEYEQKGDVQNDELQQNSHYQQIFSRIRRKELTIHEIGQLLFNAKESGIISPALNDGNYDENYEHIRDIDDEFYSHVNSIYIFPTTSHVRHNRRWEMINFKVDHSHLTIVRTIIHLYVRGHDWMREHYPEILENKVANGKARRPRNLIIMIHQVVRRPNNQNLTHTMKIVESRHRIPSGLGQWVQFEIKHIPSNWLNKNTATMTLAIKTQESWMRSFLVIDSEATLNKQFVSNAFTDMCVDAQAGILFLPVENS